jgi:putative DNA primase/helicase
VRRVLYRLPELCAAPIVFVVEGEKDVETLRAHGFVATTNAGGANAWRHEYAHYLAGREVVLIPDNDLPGWQRVFKIARDLIGVAAHLMVQEIRGAKDVTEWFDRGHSECELIALLEEGHRRGT